MGEEIIPPEKLEKMRETGDAMLVFDDESLKRLKERLHDPIDDEIDKSLEALIARLESSESTLRRYREALDNAKRNLELAEDDHSFSYAMVDCVIDDIKQALDEGSKDPK